MAKKADTYFIPEFEEEESGRKKLPKNSPRSTRIIWIIAAAVGAILVLIIFSMEDPNARRAIDPTKPPEGVEIMPATGMYSDSSAIREMIYQNLRDEIIESQRQAARESSEAAAPVVVQEPKKSVRVVVKPPSEAAQRNREMKMTAMFAAPQVGLGSVETAAAGADQGGSASESTALGGTASGGLTPEGSALGGLGGLETAAGLTAALTQQQGGSVDTNMTAMSHQDRANQYVGANVNKGGAGGEYLSSGRKYPQSRYELKAGSVISGVMMGGINSDLPGTIVGQVTENVYDTATGAYRLIPQGSRMVGTYDSHIVYGQNRILVVWSRIIFPDGSSINLEGMQGSDQSGYSGFKQKIDRHYGRMLGAALFASVFVAAGKEVTKNDTSTTNNNGENRSTESIFAESVMENVTNVATQMIEKNMNVAPTLRILPGYRFSIITTKDIAFAEPYSLPSSLSATRNGGRK